MTSPPPNPDATAAPSAAVASPPDATSGKAPRVRVDALDLARGIAITLMILSHGVKGLLEFESFPDWGLVPVHAITKFSSSLFILVFGMAAVVAYGPHVGQPTWPLKRRRMIIRGLTILFWYKVLTIAEMSPRHPPETVIDALLYRTFPVFTEILGFYGIALIWLPFALWGWMRLPLAAKIAVPPLLAILAHVVANHVDFTGHESLQAILVERDDQYTWGQLSRAPLIFAGMLLAGWIAAWHEQGVLRLRAAALFGSAAAILLGAFLAVASGTLDADLMAIAHNAGKHPPELKFMLFSLGGACLMLALSFLGGRQAAVILRPITVIGRNPLQAFIAHIFVICVFYRNLLGYWHAVSYEKALQLTAIAFALTVLWIEVLEWLKRLQRPAR